MHRTIYFRHVSQWNGFGGFLEITFAFLCAHLVYVEEIPHITRCLAN